MKRVVLVGAAIVIVDQAIKQAVWMFVPPGTVTWLGAGAVTLQFGHMRHYADFARMAIAWLPPLGLVAVGAWVTKSALPVPTWRLFALAAILMGVELCTQSIDLIARGYAIDYMGWGIDIQYGEIMHLGDIAATAGYGLTIFAAIAALCNHKLARGECKRLMN